jgi:hypothetical protein
MTSERGATTVRPSVAQLGAVLWRSTEWFSDRPGSTNGSR